MAWRRLPAGMADLRARLGGMTGRERRLARFALCIMLGGAALAARDARDLASRRLVEAEAAAGAREAIPQAKAQGRLAQDLALAEAEVRAWTWEAPSPQVGRVSLERRLATMADAAGLRDVQVEGRPEVETLGGVMFVRLDITAEFDWQAVARLFSALDEANKGYLVDRFARTGADPEGLALSLRMPVGPIGASP